MKSLTDIQTGVRVVARNASISLTDTDGLSRFNTIYRGVAALMPFPELRRQDTSITTTGGTARYPWIVDPVFLDVRSVEIQDGDDEDKYKLIYPVPDEGNWNAAGNRAKQSVPDYYVRDYASLLNKIEFRPTPRYAKTVRVTGIIEPKRVYSGANKTIFLQNAADDALEYMIAADWLATDGFTDFAANRVQLAMSIYQSLFGKDAVPVEKIESLVRS